MPSITRSGALIVALALAGCAAYPEHQSYAGGRCLDRGASTLVSTFAETAAVETGVLGATVRPRFSFYEGLRVPRGTVLAERSPGEFCTDRTRFFPAGGEGLPNGEIRNPNLPGNAHVCFWDRDGDGRFEAATAHDVSDRRGENAEPATVRLPERPRYALAGCEDAAPGA